MDGRRATPCALKHPLSAYPTGVFYYESHALLHLVRADPTMASIGVRLVVVLVINSVRKISGEGRGAAAECFGESNTLYTAVGREFRR